MNPDMVLSSHLDLLKGVAQAGFALAMHVRFATPSHVFQTYPEAWADEYARHGLVMQDPTVAWAFERQGHITWDELESSDRAGVFRRAAAHGLRHGVTVSLRDGTRSLGGFARSDRPFTAGEIETIEATMAEIHRITASAGPHDDADAP